MRQPLQNFQLSYRSFGRINLHAEDERLFKRESIIFCHHFGLISACPLVQPPTYRLQGRAGGFYITNFIGELDKLDFLTTSFSDKIELCRLSLTGCMYAFHRSQLIGSFIRSCYNPASTSSCIR
jgi:hypothetical protein